MTSEGVTVLVEQRSTATVVRVSGVVDALALSEVSRALTDAQRDHLMVVVDLEGVSFMDSRGLGALLAANERAREGAAPISILRPSAAVRRLMDVSGVSPVFTEIDSIPE